MENFINSLWTFIADLAMTAGLRILGAILILIIGSKLIKWIVSRVSKGAKFADLTPNVRVLIVDCIKVVLYILLIVIIASTLGIETASITAAIASAGLAVGLALQGSLANFAGGIMILIFKPFSVGDFIDDGSHTGTVADIGIFYTKLETPDNKVITIPNGALSNTTVTDYSVKDVRRLDLEFSVAYDSDIARVKEVLTATASAHSLVLSEPAEPFVRLGKHGESALVFFLRVWVNGADYWTVNFDLLEEGKLALDRAGISIPYPQVDVHIDQK